MSLDYIYGHLCESAEMSESVCWADVCIQTHYCPEELWLQSCAAFSAVMLLSSSPVLKLRQRPIWLVGRMTPWDLSAVEIKIIIICILEDPSIVGCLHGTKLCRYDSQCTITSMGCQPAQSAPVITGAFQSCANQKVKQQADSGDHSCKARLLRWTYIDVSSHVHTVAVKRHKLWDSDGQLGERSSAWKSFMCNTQEKSMDQ